MIRLNPQINVFLIFTLTALCVYIFKLYYKKKKLLIPFIFELLSAFLILLLLIKPILIMSFKAKKGNKLLVLIDKSESMKIKNNKGKPRIERVKEILSRNEFFKKYDPSFFVFDKDIKKIEKNEIENVMADGKKTCISKNISEILKGYKEDASGLIIFTDGQNNCQRVNLHETKIPVYCIGIGGEKIKDVRIDNVITNSPVYTGDRIKIDVYISQNGLKGEKIEVSLKESNKFLKRKKIYLDGNRTKVSFEKKIEKQGLFLYKVEVEKQDMETQNNVFPFLVRAISPKIKILYIDGYLRWEYKYLKRFLSGYSRAEPVLFVKVGEKLYQQTMGKKIKIKNGLFSDYSILKGFNIIIFGDISFLSFTDEEMENIKKFVEEGGGIIFMGGKNFLKGTSHTPLENLLPVRNRNKTFLKEGKFQLNFTTIGKNIPGFEIKKPPSISTLNISNLSEGAFSIITADNFPFLACKLSGKGKSMSINTDSLWRWYISGNKDKYLHLFSRIIYYLCPPENYFRQGAVSEIPQRKYLIGEIIKGTIKNPDEKNNINVYVKDIQSGEKKRLNINKKGEFKFTPDKEGNYIIEVQGGKMKTYRLLTVYSNPELFKLERDDNYLKAITGTMGGQYIQEEKIKEPLNLKLRKKLTYKKFAIYRKGEIFIIFLIFVLLNISWFLKRRYSII